jgi:hypothetical protein
MKLDSATDTNAHYPSVGFDPVTKRFLAAWEDLRGGANTKIFGQLVQSGGGKYNADFIISFEDLNNDTNNDDNVANSKQSKPFVAYDPVNQRFFTIWQDGRNSTLSLENLDLYGQKIDAEGSLRGNNYAIFTLPDNQYTPTIAYNDEMNHFLAVWKDARNADVSTCSPGGGVGTGAKPCGSDVYGQRFTLGNPSLTLLNPDNAPLTPPLLNQFENPSGSGVVEVGLSDTQSFKIRNTGDTILKIDYINLTCSGGSIAPFSFDGLPSQLTASDGNTIDLVPGAELTLTVRFTPVAGGSFNKCFTIESDGGNPQVNLSALSVEANIAITSPVTAPPQAPDPYNFGNVSIGSTKDATFVVKNAGLAHLTISSLVAPAPPFSVQSDGCTGQSIDPGMTCNIVVRYTPAAIPAPPFTSSSSFGINSNDPDTPILTLNISGSSVGAENKNIAPVSINFGNVQVGQTSSSQTITVTSNGTLPLTISSITSPANPPFSMGHNCPLSPATLAVGNSCQINVQFSPTVAGGVSSSITVNTPNALPNVTVNLSGTGVTTPQISVNPAFVNFPSTQVGSASQLTVTVTNIGSANLNITSITNPTPDFSISGTNCIGSIVPTASCTITVSFSPAAVGIQNSSFVINSNDPVNAAFTVNLSGTGSSSGGGGGTPNIVVNPLSWDFGTITVGTTSPSKIVRIRNTGTGNLALTSIQYPGTPFRVTGDNCTGKTLAPGVTCRIQVVFNPISAATFNPFYLVINSDDPDTPQVKVTFKGKGVR